MKIHLIPNAHLDPVWLWDWREGLNEGLTTVRTILDLMDEDPELTFIRGEATIYRHLEKTDPATFARIAPHIASGRWDVVGGTEIQPDTNLPATATLLRHFESGSRYFASRFGKKPNGAWAADSFGHSAGLPEILSASGMDAIAFTRPFPEQVPIDSPAFWWEGQAGSRVLGYRPWGIYTNDRHEMVPRLDGVLKSLGNFSYLSLLIMIDTHLHLWNPSSFHYPWLEGIPALNGEFSLHDYQEASNGNIQASVFIECAASAESFLQEAHWILEIASVPENRIAGVVASIWPEREDFAVNLHSIAGHPRLKGLRRVLHTEPDELSQAKLFRENVAGLGEQCLTFDLCVLERQLPLAIDLVDACSGTSFVLDHCGVPDIAGNKPEFWRSHISELAKRPHIVCKVSGLLLYAAESRRSAKDILPWFEHVVEQFEWDRLIWGGDWPVCTLAVPLQSWISITETLLDLAGASPVERQAFLQKNAKSVYQLDSEV